MAFATPQERARMADPVANTFPLELVVQYASADGREWEVAADCVDHAMDIAHDRVRRMNAQWAEIFRVNADGTLRPTIGRITADD